MLPGGNKAWNIWDIFDPAGKKIRTVYPPNEMKKEAESLVKRVISKKINPSEFINGKYNTQDLQILVKLRAGLNLIIWQGFDDIRLDKNQKAMNVVALLEKAVNDKIRQQTGFGARLTIDATTAVDDGIYSLLHGRARLSQSRLTGFPINAKDTHLLARVSSGVRKGIFNFMVAGFITTLVMAPEGQAAFYPVGSLGTGVPLAMVDLTPYRQNLQEETALSPAGVVETQGARFASGAADNAKTIRRVLQFSKKIEALADYDAQKTVEFRMRVSPEFVPNRIGWLEELTRSVMEVTKGTVLIQIIRPGEDFKDLSQGRSKDEYGIVYMGSLNEGLLTDAKGHGIAATTENAGDGFLPDYFAQMVFSVFIQRFSAPHENLIQLWDNLAENPLVSLTDARNFKKLKNVADNARLEDYQELTFRLLPMNWEEAIQSTFESLRVLGSAA
jgi:hypothetical protein